MRPLPNLQLNPAVEGEMSRNNGRTKSKYSGVNYKSPKITPPFVTFPSELTIGLTPNITWRSNAPRDVTKFQKSITTMLSVVIGGCDRTRLSNTRTNTWNFVKRVKCTIPELRCVENGKLYF